MDLSAHLLEAVGSFSSNSGKALTTRAFFPGSFPKLLITCKTRQSDNVTSESTFPGSALRPQGLGICKYDCIVSEYLTISVHVFDFWHCNILCSGSFPVKSVTKVVSLQNVICTS
jgi:hypothetical protein